MVQLQILNRLLKTKDFSFIENNLIDKDYFTEYADEFDFISNHYKQYNSIPDTTTFIEKFPEFELLDVEESEEYLLDKIKEEYLYSTMVPIITKSAEYIKDDANVGVQYLMSAMKNINPNYNLNGTDIIANAIDRYEQFIERKENPDKWYFTTGFEELDDEIHGIQREEELFVIFARTNQGKSWILEKIITHIWKLGFNVGYISPEMSATSIGYRFDTLYKNFSNVGLMWGNNDIDDVKYKEYIDGLKAIKSKFIVATPIDFSNKITVSKLKNWCKKYELNVLAVDGIKYLTDERYKRGDNTTTSLTNISEDLMSLSMELGIPVLVVVQANRQGVKADDENGTPELDTIRDSDGISHNASKVLSIRQRKNGVLEMCIKKQRFGRIDGKLLYNWDIDKGDFNFIPSYDDAQSSAETQERVDTVKKQFVDKEDIF